MATFTSQLAKLTETNEQRLDQLRQALKDKLKAIQ